VTDNRYQHVIKAIFGTPWAIYPPTLELILDVVRFRAQGGRLSAEEIQERIAGAENGPRELAVAGRPARATTGAVAVIPIYGIIAPRASMFESTSTRGTSLEHLAADFRAAMADPEITAIAFDIDSPGGMVDGVEEMAAEIRRSRGAKPIAAVANFMAASAAYYLAAQADEVVVSPSGQVGSIGVLTAHQDLSEMYAQMGVKTTLIRHGKFKAEANEFEPLNDDARAEIQKRVDEWGGMFEAAVAAGRGITPAKVRSDYGQGRMMLAKAAKAAGLADRIDTLEGTIARLGKGTVKARPATGAALALVQRLEELGDPDRAYDNALEAKLAEYGYGRDQIAELTYPQALALAAAATSSVDDQAAAATRTRTTTTVTESVTETDDDDDTPGDDPDPDDDTGAAQATGSTFSTRLQAVTAEAAEIEAIARTRAERRHDRKRPLSAAHQAQLRELGERLLATAALGDDQDDDQEPETAVKPSPRLQVQLAAARGGYRLKH
jgi:signal peptide peptidase SppA